MGFSACLSWSRIADCGDTPYRFSIWLEHSHCGICPHVYRNFEWVLWDLCIYGVALHSSNLKGSQTLEEIFVQVEDRDIQILKLVEGVNSEVSSAIKSALDRTVIGGGYREQLLGIDKSLAMINGRLVSNPAQAAILDYLIEALSKEKGESRERLGQL